MPGRLFCRAFSDTSCTFGRVILKYNQLDKLEFDEWTMEAVKCVTEYRITKYNPANRINGAYMTDEWTSISDIGKVFDGTILSQDTYLKTEKAYIDCCIELIEKAKISKLSIKKAEYYTDNMRFPSSISNAQEIRQVITACLREQCWLKLVAKDFFIHFGYDYYMYVGSVLSEETVAVTATKYGLFCEEHPSPYN